MKTTQTTQGFVSTVGRWVATAGGALALGLTLGLGSVTADPIDYQPGDAAGHAAADLRAANERQAAAVARATDARWTGDAAGFAEAAGETRMTALAEHAVVGSWLTATDAGTAAFAPVLMTFHGDGTYADIGANGGSKAGTWQPRGANAVALTTFVVLRDRSSAFLGSTTILGTLTLSDDGQTLAGTYTIELTGADRTSSGPIELDPTTSTRLITEPVDDPAQRLPESGPR